jgi:hypothetical protein
MLRIKADSAPTVTSRLTAVHMSTLPPRSSGLEVI